MITVAIGFVLRATVDMIALCIFCHLAMWDLYFWDISLRFYVSKPYGPNATQTFGYITVLTVRVLIRFTCKFIVGYSRYSFFINSQASKICEWHSRVQWIESYKYSAGCSEQNSRERVNNTGYLNIWMIRIKSINTFSWCTNASIKFDPKCEIYHLFKIAFGRRQIVEEMVG